MKISELFNKNRCVFSFEVFPPKKDTPAEGIYSTLDSLKKLSPDFISVTYGAGGTNGDNVTGDIASYINNNLGIVSAAHLTCVSNTKEDIDIILGDLKNKGVEKQGQRIAENDEKLGYKRQSQQRKNDFRRYFSYRIVHYFAHGYVVFIILQSYQYGDKAHEIQNKIYCQSHPKIPSAAFKTRHGQSQHFFRRNNDAQKQRHLRIFYFIVFYHFWRTSLIFLTALGRRTNFSNGSFTMASC